MRNHFQCAMVLLTAFLLSAPTLTLQAQCTPTDFTINSTNQLVNAYYPGTQASVPIGATSITLGAAEGASAAITAGDLLLIIQMQGASINSTNTNSYGDGVSTGDASGFTSATAGTYEFAIAQNSLSTAGGTLSLTTGTTYSYANNAATATTGAYRYQVIRVPRYRNLNVTGGSITAPAWNGIAGGVVSFEVTGTMSVAGTFINVAAKGFRGGAGQQLNATIGGFSNSDVRTTTTVNGSKGEGIAGTPRYVRTAGLSEILDAGTETYPGGSNAMGAPGNAGGGGTDGNPSGGNNQNSGGGGGGNGGAGGRGGNSWSTNQPVGGFGGVRPGFLTSSRLILGGGGGAGSTNDGTGGGTPAGIASSGGAGGGLVLIKVGLVSGSGTINANGEVGGSVAQDGAGGGGAGGTVYIAAGSTANLAGITVTARGGTGGTAWATQSGTGSEHGPGGGGGGGVIYATHTLNTASSVAAGMNGTTLTTAIPFGATAGAPGTINQAAASIAPVYNSVCGTYVLPVKFISFAAVRQTNGITLTWSVADEQHVKAYEVEKSADGVAFTKIVELPYQQSEDAKNKYTYTDAAITSPVQYYRIREVDNNGKFTYSKVVSVKLEGGASLQVLPNPAYDKTTIQVNSSRLQNGVLQLVNLSGAVVKEQKVALKKGFNSMVLDGLQQYAKGTYFIKLTLAEGTLYKKIIIK